MTKISEFQREKLEYYFNFFKSDGKCYLEHEDLSAFMKKIRKYTGWNENSTAALECHEIHSVFFEVLKEKTYDRDSIGYKISERQWFEFWDSMLPGCMGMHNFPIWLRLLPKSLFRIIDKKGDGFIDEEELAEFYEKMVKIKAEDAKSLSKKAYTDMTDNGRYPLNVEGYEQIFANFLLGQTPYGPGRYIFGCFEHALEKKNFRLIKEPSTMDSDILPENFKPVYRTERRPSLEAHGGR